MRALHRRAFLASTAVSLVAARANAAPAQSYVAPVQDIIGQGPPVAPVRPVTETYYGVKVTDRYRWMESEDAEWQTYVRAQGAYTASVLAKIPGRDRIAAAIAHDS